MAKAPDAAVGAPAATDSEDNEYYEDAREGDEDARESGADALDGDEDTDSAPSSPAAHHEAPARPASRLQPANRFFERTALESEPAPPVRIPPATITAIPEAVVMGEEERGGVPLAVVAAVVKPPVKASPKATPVESAAPPATVPSVATEPAPESAPAPGAVKLPSSVASIVAAQEAADVRCYNLPRSHLPEHHPLSTFTLTRAFALFDRDHDGRLSLHELKMAALAIAFVSDAAATSPPVAEATAEATAVDSAKVYVGLTDTERRSFAELGEHYQNFGADETNGLYLDDFIAIMKAELVSSRRRALHVPAPLHAPSAATCTTGGSSTSSASVSHGSTSRVAPVRPTRQRSASPESDDDVRLAVGPSKPSANKPSSASSTRLRWKLRLRRPWRRVTVSVPSPAASSSLWF